MLHEATEATTTEATEATTAAAGVVKVVLDLLLFQGDIGGSIAVAMLHNFVVTR